MSKPFVVLLLLGGFVHQAIGQVGPYQYQQIIVNSQVQIAPQNWLEWTFGIPPQYALPSFNAPCTLRGHIESLNRSKFFASVLNEDALSNFREDLWGSFDVSPDVELISNYKRDMSVAWNPNAYLRPRGRPYYFVVKNKEHDAELVVGVYVYVTCNDPD
jgi:hypothetical protein